MHTLPHDRGQNLRPLFEDFPGMHGAIEAALEGSLGEMFVDDIERPRVARIVIGDFSLIAGDASAAAAAEALHAVPHRDYLATPESWLDVVPRVLANAFPNDRFAMQAPGHWDHAALARLRESLPAEYRLVRVDTSNVEAFGEMNETFVGNFRSTEDFLERGVGFAVTLDGRIVAGCSTYSISKHCLEFEIETHRDYQRRGLALVTGATMIEYCIDNGLEACWDAAHEGSAVLAERLGFVGRRPYTAFRVGIPAGPPEEDG